MKRRIDAKMRNKYTLASDLADRLDHCYFMYKEQPVLCTVRDHGETLKLWDVTGNEVIADKVSPSDPDLDIASIELGYVQSSPYSGNRVAYLSRWPEKRYKQGVCSNNVKVNRIDGTPAGGFQVLGTKEFGRMLADDYDDILGRLSDLEVGEYAISKDIAIKKTNVGVVFVYYKMDEVGWIPPKEQGISIIDREWSWVIERMLRSSGINIVRR